jgi:rhomboid protease GluP
MNWLRRLSQAPVTSGLIVANLAIYVGMALSSHTLTGFSFETMIYGGANVVGTHQDVSHWRWLTAAFVHFNLLHIGVNLWSLTQIGVISEATIGAGVIAASYVTTGVLGNLVSTVFNSLRHHPTQSAGASGAIMGLIGIVAAFAWRTNQKGISRALAMNVGVILVLGMFFNFDNATHIGGFVSGAIIGLLRARWPQPLSRRLQVALISASALVTVAAFAIVHSYNGYH